jgi:hypothetical protein
VKWRTLVALVVADLFLCVVIVFVMGSLQGSPKDEFTAEEEAIIEALSPLLDTLVLQQEDLSSLAGRYEECDDYGLAGVEFRYRTEDSSVNVEDVLPAEAGLGPVRDSVFCDYDSGAFISSIVSLPANKEHFVDLQRVNAALSHGEHADLDELIEDVAGRAGPEDQIGEYRWLQTPAVGDAGYAWELTVYSDGGQDEVYRFHFIRGTVSAELTLRIPSSATAEYDARALAQTLDNRIASKLESLAAEVRVP